MATTGFWHEWREVRHGSPGRRFQEYYQRAHQRRDRRGWIGRVLRIAVAVASFAIGIVLVFIPGPAVLFFAMTGALLANESRAVARFLDWSEIKLRHAGAVAGRTWRSWSTASKLVLATTLGAALGAISHLLYALFIR